MLRTSGDVPQASVIINGIPSKCSGDCSFQWIDAPVVTCIDTSNPDEIRLEGQGFDAVNIANNLVMIGNALCEVTAANETFIVCSPGNLISEFNFKPKYKAKLSKKLKAKAQLDHLILN
jgi:hypothetical protein